MGILQEVREYTAQRNQVLTAREFPGGTAVIVKHNEGLLFQEWAIWETYQDRDGGQWLVVYSEHKEPVLFNMEDDEPVWSMVLLNYWLHYINRQEDKETE